MQALEAEQTSPWAFYGKTKDDRTENMLIKHTQAYATQAVRVRDTAEGVAHFPVSCFRRVYEDMSYV